MANQTDVVLKTAATIIKNETVANANTASRVGTMLENIIDSKINNDAIDTDATLSANSDSLVPSQKAVKANMTTTVKVSFTAAEILQLFTTPKTLVAAKGAGTVIVPLRILINFVYNSVTYTTNLNLILGNGTLFQTTLTDALNPTANQLATYTVTTAATSATPAASTNVDMKLSAATGNPLAGNSTMDVYLTYIVISL